MAFPNFPSSPLSLVGEIVTLQARRSNITAGARREASRDHAEWFAFDPVGASLRYDQSRSGRGGSAGFRNTESFETMLLALQCDDASATARIRNIATRDGSTSTHCKRSICA